ncbi:HlyD family secretion protein [Gilvibacter sediminis]|uniref:HlyD family secretion protein n=1 Tax=Gilvibacter sediminis TaxID=379071 RepID=UPI002350AE13|nr:HlyD family efflux transporter periplasmic adaptor subunit [Gilvibacter sediminis]MDC7997400.1 HlyD family efflux transporter periplasmic adaptor subunit [Gilvibacter sediminis]
MENDTIDRSQAVKDILTKAPHWMLFGGNLIILGMLVLFFLFSWFIKYPDVIETEALITSEQPPQKEYAQISGKIDTLLVKDKEEVLSGEILAMLENTASLKDVLLLKAITDTISLDKDAFAFPIESIPALNLGEIATAYTLFESDYLDYVLNKDLDPISNQIQVNQYSVSELQLRKANLERQRELDLKKFELSSNEFERNKTLYDKGVISLNEFEAKKISFLDKQRALKNLEISLSQLNQQISQAQMNTKDSQINHTLEHSKRFKNALQAFLALREAITTWELKYLLKANMAGTVSLLNIWNKNQYVQAGELLFSIVPDTQQNYVAKIKAPIANSGKIKTGQDVNILLFNYPEEEYGMLSAKIESMSAIPNENGFYLVNASLESSLVTTYDIAIPFKSELNGTANIVTEDLRLLERFFYQLRGLF